MKYSLAIWPEAEADLREAFEWLEEKRAGLGEEFLDCVETVFNRLKISPSIHAISYRTIRQTLVRRFPYVVCYFLEGESVIVVAIYHANRDPRAWQERLGDG